MKKTASLLLVLFLTLSTLALTVSATPALVVGSGDVNGDGDVNEFDYLVVKRAYFDTYTLTSDEISAADVDQNGDIDQLDYLCIKRHHFGTYVIGGNHTDTSSRNIPFTSKVFEATLNDNYPTNGVYPTPFVINTQDELEALVLNCSGADEALLDYGEEFFDENSLIITYVERYFEHEYWYDSIYADEDGVHINVFSNRQRLSYLYGTNEFLVAEVKKEDVAEYQVFNIDISEHTIILVVGKEYERGEKALHLTTDEEAFFLDLFNNRTWSEMINDKVTSEVLVLIPEALIVYYPEQNCITDYYNYEYILTPEEKAKIDAIIEDAYARSKSIYP